MPQLSESKLQADIKNDVFFPVYFLYGEESYLLGATVKAMIKKTVPPDFSAFNLQEFDGEMPILDQLATAVEALPMFALKKCVAVKNLAVDKLLKADLEMLEQLLKNPNPSTVLVLYYTKPVDVKLVKVKKILELIKAQGVVCEFAKKDAKTLLAAVSKHCQTQKVQIQPNAAKRLIEQCQFSFGEIKLELDKMTAYVGAGGVIDEQVVKTLGTATVQATAFALSDAIVGRRFALAFELLDRLFYLRLDPIMVLGALSMSILDFYRLKVAQNVGVSTEQVGREFAYRSKYRLSKTQPMLARTSLLQVRKWIAALEQADRALKSSKIDNRLILEQMIGEMMAA